MKWNYARFFLKCFNIKQSSWNIVNNVSITVGDLIFNIQFLLYIQAHLTFKDLSATEIKSANVSEARAAWSADTKHYLKYKMCLWQLLRNSTLINTIILNKLWYMGDDQHFHNATISQ